MENPFRDPKWLEIGASLRGGKLYIKMPLYVARMASVALDVVVSREGEALSEANASRARSMAKFLAREAQAASANLLNVVIFSLTREAARKDLEMLLMAGPRDIYRVIDSFSQALLKGLGGDPEVDWIARTGGPGPG